MALRSYEPKTPKNSKTKIPSNLLRHFDPKWKFAPPFSGHFNYVNTRTVLCHFELSNQAFTLGRDANLF